ncbi:hypothetical protein [Cohnella pontilimi]|nr:hypothetical protein [Cohnella pontilimi]
MKNKKIFLLTLALFALLLTSACGTKANNNGAVTDTNGAATDAGNTKPAATADAAAPTETNEQILIIIDQTPKPIEGNSFDFGVQQLPEGYALAEMQWISKENLIVNSIQDAIQHGASGEDGFYISGNGQYTGFFYPDTMKGETGQVVFLFKNAEGKELTWKKEITLK